MQINLDQLERSYFEHGLFQAWMILSFLFVYGVSAWATLSLGLPIQTCERDRHIQRL
jgi:hypothetical protein